MLTHDCVWHEHLQEEPFVQDTLRSWCILPAKQVTAFTTDNRHHQEDNFQFARKAWHR